MLTSHLKKGVLDVTFDSKLGDAEDPDLEYTRCCSQQLVAAVNRSNPLARRKRIELKDLRGQHVVSCREGIPGMSEVKFFTDRAGVMPDWKYESEITLSSIVVSNPGNVALLSYSFLVDAFKDVACIPVRVLTQYKIKPRTSLSRIEACSRAGRYTSVRESVSSAVFEGSLSTTLCRCVGGAACRREGRGLMDEKMSIAGGGSPQSSYHGITALLNSQFGATGVYALNAVIAICMAIWLWKFGVETRGRTLEEITKDLYE